MRRVRGHDGQVRRWLCDRHVRFGADVRSWHLADIPIEVANVPNRA